MLVFVLLFFIMVISVGLSAYIYLSESKWRWVLVLLFTAMLLSLFIYVRLNPVPDGLGIVEQKYRFFFRESLGAMTYWCAVVLLLVSVFSIPKSSLKDLKYNALGYIYSVGTVVALLKLWSL